MEELLVASESAFPDYVDVGWFCRNAGIDEGLARSLIEAGKIGRGVFDDAGRALGLLDDSLPTRAELADLGIEVDDLYRPDRLHSFGDDQPPSRPTEPSWTMKSDERHE